MATPPPEETIRRTRPRLNSHLLYSVGWLAQLDCERAVAEALCDERHGAPLDFDQRPLDNLVYSWGRIGTHNIVIASLPAGHDEVGAAATTATWMLSSFPNIRFGLLVGIGGAIPKIEKVGSKFQINEDRDIRLGDIVVSEPSRGHGGVIQYDHYRATTQGLQNKSFLSSPSEFLLYALSNLKSLHYQRPPKVAAIIRSLEKTSPFMVLSQGYKHPGSQQDRLFNPDYAHSGGNNCSNCSEEGEIKRDPRSGTNPKIHYGLIASGNVEVKDASKREELLKHMHEADECLCYETAAAGLMNDFPCLVVRGMCDYSDSHSTYEWRNYAALAAGAFAKELLLSMDGEIVGKEETANGLLDNQM